MVEGMDSGSGAGMTRVTLLRLWKGSVGRQSDLDNHADQMNPNNEAYWESRAWDDRPEDWEDRVEDEDTLADRAQDDRKGSREAK